MSGPILVAEADPFGLRLLEGVCEEAGLEVVTAGDGSAALNVVARQRPTLIVLDHALCTEDGAPVLEVLQSEPDLREIPVLLTTGAEEEPASRPAVELGAVDFLTRPYRVFEVEQRIRTLLRLSAAEEAAQKAAYRGPATPGGPGQLLVCLEYEVTRAERYAHPLTCVVLRVLNLEAVVAEGGASVGNEVLATLAEGLRRSIRAIDHLFRSDAGEFTILLPETSREGSRGVTQRIAQRAEDGSLLPVAVEPAPALAVGLASLEVGDALADPQGLHQRALDALAPVG